MLLLDVRRVLEPALVRLAGINQQESGQQQERPRARGPGRGRRLRLGRRLRRRGDAPGVPGIVGAVADSRGDAVLLGELGQGLVDTAAEDASHLPEPAGRPGTGGLLCGGGLGQGSDPGDRVPGANLIPLLLLLSPQRPHPGLIDAPPLLLPYSSGDVKRPGCAAPVLPTASLHPTGRHHDFCDTGLRLDPLDMLRSIV